jgi:hypothetical protein
LLALYIRTVGSRAREGIENGEPEIFAHEKMKKEPTRAPNSCAETFLILVQESLSGSHRSRLRTEPLLSKFRLVSHLRLRVS